MIPDLKKLPLRSFLVYASGILIIAFLFAPIRHLYFLSDAWGDMHFSKTNPFRFFITDTYLSKLGRHYRPLWRLSMWIQHILSGDAWYRPHVTFTFTFSWHLLAASGVFALLRQLKAGILASLLGMLAFAIHPAIVEPVAWSAAESFLLAGMFGVWAVVFALRELTGSGSRRGWILPIILAICSMLSNEIGLGIPPLLIALWYIYRYKSASDLLPIKFSGIGFPAICFGIVILYLGIRFALFGAVSNWKPGPSPGGISRMAESADYFKFIASRLLWNYWPIWLEDKVSVREPWLYNIMGFGIVALAVYYVLRREVWACFVLGIFLTCATWYSSHRIFLQEDEPFIGYLENTRIMYIAYIWWGVLVGLLLSEFQKQASSIAYRTVIGITLFVLCQYAVNTRLNLRTWVDASRLVRSFVETLPKALPEPPTDKPIYLKNFPPFIVSSPIAPGTYTTKAYTFQVAVDTMVKYAYKDDRITAEIQNGETPDGQVEVQLGENGIAVRSK